MKISILMPTYNDEQYIASAIKSVVDQTYPNWELLIMDDGSTDDTASVVKTFNDERICFFQQNNQGQLKALHNLCDFITGDIVMMLHSDDLLYKDTSLELNVKHFEDPSIDGIYCSIVQFFQSGKPDRETQTIEVLSKNAPVKLLTLLGSNFIPDPFFIRKNKFFKHVQYNYLKWNYQYWLNFTDKNVTNLNLRYSSITWYYYRIHDENYSNSVIGNFETFLGRMRSVYLLSDYYAAPFPSIQKELARRFNFSGFVFQRAASKKHVAKLIKLLITSMKKRTPGAYTWYFDQLHAFYTISIKKSIKLQSKIESEYFGCEGRKFFKDLNENSVPTVYHEIITKLKDGFSSVTVNNELERYELESILKFLCIRANIIVQP
jgi:glycosyltransferase involved in cell wall biosynthesis